MRLEADAATAPGLLDSSNPVAADREVESRAASRMQLVLILPGLLEAQRSGEPALRGPALAELLALGGPPSRGTDGLDAAIASRYGIERQADWPLAAIRAASLGLQPGDAYWLTADPVTLVVGRDEVALAGIVEDLSRADADALASTLNAHFVNDGVVFVAPRPDAIFARLANPPHLTTHPPVAMKDEPLRLRLPQGADAPTWRRWQSEIQMLLHEHPVNVGREESGRPPVNGLWLSAGGVLPPRTSPDPPVRTYADAGIAVALAAHIGVPAQPVPTQPGGALEPADARAGQTIVVALPTDIALADIERSWAAPARDALASGQLTEVSILARDAGDCVSWRALRPRLWQRIAGRARRRDLAAEIAAALRA